MSKFLLVSSKALEKLVFIYKKKKKGCTVHHIKFHNTVLLKIMSLTTSPLSTARGVKVDTCKLARLFNFLKSYITAATIGPMTATSNSSAILMPTPLPTPTLPIF